MAKKKLLIYAHYYIPDTASTGQILRELAEGMLDKFDITVICVVPSYLGTIEDKYKTQKYYEEEINGVKVLRIRVPEFSKTNKKSRVKNIVSYFFGAMGATFKVGKMDYVFSISQPPILGGLLGVWGKWIKHAKYMLLPSKMTFLITITNLWNGGSISITGIPIKKCWISK